ncbi:Twin-arginine translocation protein TatA [hydrothermal vent metagenome]|uniref:Twin-arginine translocation protein TatA n=1 Tax=hydrothermal vent metagenome TaxID=652676 RepID=A0A1W1BZ72_9ZZZZ
MGMPGMPELLVILLIVVLLFGAKKIPDLAKGVGKGIKDFKKAVKEDSEEDTTKAIEKNEEKVAEIKPTETKNENA